MDPEESGRGAKRGRWTRGTEKREGGGRPIDPEPTRGPSANRYTVLAKVEALRDFARGSLTLRAFCKERGLNSASFCRWRKAYKALGEAGLIARPNRRNTGGRTGRVIPPEERRALVEAYQKLKVPQAAFAKQYGVSVASLGNWLRAYRAGGPKALEPKQRGRKKGSGSMPRLPDSVRAEIVKTKRRFPFFGLRKVKDYLLRFVGVHVSAGGVKSTLEAASIPAVLPRVKKRRRGPDQIRRFERSRPLELWQSDITSYVLRRESRRVYLTVFLDDYSRYIVSFGLALRQTSDLVCDTLLDGISRFSKPLEVLTDQGRQYFAWRGKTEFQKLLDREGIRHVVSRAHHPETLGKCERLWSTIGKEFWERARPQDLEDARTRLAHFVAHYNHFRPHQSLEGLVPADRFFGQTEAVRDEIETQLAENELRLALDEPPRKKVFLMGQVGEAKVSLRGERGRLVIETEQGLLEAMDLEEAGNDRGEVKHEHEDEHEHEHERDREQGGAERERDDDLGGAGVVDDSGLDERDLGAGPFDEPGVDASDLDDIEPDAGGADEAAAALGEAALPEAAATGGGGEGPDRVGDSGGAAASALDVPADSRLVAGSEGEARGGVAAERAGAESVAVEPAGAVGDDRGTPEAAAAEAGARTDADRGSDDVFAGNDGWESAGDGEGAAPREAGALGGEPGERDPAPIPVAGEDGAGGEGWTDLEERTAEADAHGRPDEVEYRSSSGTRSDATSATK